MDEKDPYPILLSIDCAFNNKSIIHMEKETMTFEVDGTSVAPLSDPCQGCRYVKPNSNTFEDNMLDQIYKLIRSRCVDYINHIDDGMVCWRNIYSFDSD